MDVQAKSCKVTIFGDEYTLLSNETEAHVIESAKLIDSCMQEIASKAKISDGKKVAVLAALRIASRVLQLEAQQEKKEHQLKSLVQELDSELKKYSSSVNNG